MPRFKKKPLIVEAVQWTGLNVNDVLEFVTSAGWHGRSGDILWFVTAHGDRTAFRPGDWIVPDSEPNTFYPIKPDVMIATYDRLPD